MSLAYDLFQPGRSWLHRLDPRPKLLLAVCATAVILLYGNVWVMLGLVAALQAALWSAGLARERLAWVWRMTAPTMLLVAVLWVLFYPAQGAAWWSLELGLGRASWVVRVGPGNVARGVAVALRIGALAMAIFAWLFTTDQSTLVRGLVALGLPYEWGLTLAMALRYLPTMALTFRTISEAQQARALDLGAGGPVARARKYAPILVAMIIAALRTADQLSRVLEARALGATRRRTYLRALRYRRADLAWTLGILAATAALAWARLGPGLGADPLRLLP